MLSTFNALTPSGIITSTSTVYATARTGAGLSASTFPSSGNIGQKFGTPNYDLWEWMLGFDTAALPDADTVTDGWLYFYTSSDQSQDDFLWNLYSYDWGTTLATSDWVAGENLSALTLVGQNSNMSTGAVAIQLNAAGVAAVNKTGYTRFLLASSKLDSGTAPTRNEYNTANLSNATYLVKLNVFYVSAYTAAVDYLDIMDYDYDKGVLTSSSPQLWTPNAVAEANMVDGVEGIDFHHGEGGLVVPTEGQIWPRGAG